jgi:hypothetical protein
MEGTVQVRIILTHVIFLSSYDAMALIMDDKAIRAIKKVFTFPVPVGIANG